MADREEARRCVQLMVLAALADGHVEGTEAVAINKLVQSVHDFAHVGHIGDIGRETRHLLDERGMDACLRELAAGIPSRPMRELAFQCCARVVARAVGRRHAASLGAGSAGDEGRSAGAVRRSQPRARRRFSSSRLTAPISSSTCTTTLIA
jgi:hypothetical protein